MKVFELIKTVLDDAYSQIPEPRDDKLVDQMSRLTGSYSDLTKNDPPDYSDSATRFAYVYKYTTCHACLVADKIRSVAQLRNLFIAKQESWAKVACIGGGPGSEFLGIVKHKMLNHVRGELKCFLLDKEPAWGDTWSDVDQRTDGLGFRVSTHFQPLDIAEEKTWKTQTRYLEADLFTLVYFVSEVYKKSSEIERYLEQLFQAAKPGALFLFIDNDKPEFYDLFDKIAQRHLDRLAGASERYVTSSSEQKSSLEPYFSKFSSRAQQPKLKAHIAWRLYQKPSSQAQF